MRQGKITPPGFLPSFSLASPPNEGSNVDRYHETGLTLTLNRLGTAFHRSNDAHV